MPRRKKSYEQTAKQVVVAHRTGRFDHIFIDRQLTVPLCGEQGSSDPWETVFTPDINSGYVQYQILFHNLQHRPVSVVVCPKCLNLWERMETWEKQR